MYQTDVISPLELSDADIAAWREMQDATPALASPLLGPEFARAVASERSDARVAVWRHRGRAAAFLAYHRRPGGFGRPIGAPFCDYHGLVGRPGLKLDPGQALRSAGLAALRLTGLIDPFDILQDGVEIRMRSHRIVLTDSPLAYFNQLKARSGACLKIYQRDRARVERDIGPLTIVADRDAGAFERLLGWKRAQFLRAGAHDLLGAPWSSALMRRLFETRSDEFQGLMISLYAGDRLIAGHFGVRRGDWYHPWIGANDPEMETYSPGVLHQMEAVALMPDLHLRTYDLGPGQDPWKRMFALDGAWVGSGLATAPTPLGRLAKSSDAFWRLGVLPAAPTVGRLRDRLEQILAIEPTVGGRLRGAARAIASLPARWQAPARSDGAF
jgi:CelD/BcsL family acetyltransferase involved in cellulose biosynthesis